MIKIILIPKMLKIKEFLIGKAYVFKRKKYIIIKETKAKKHPFKGMNLKKYIS